MSLSSLFGGSTPSLSLSSSDDERRDQRLQQNLATVDGSFIARADYLPINTRAAHPHFPSLANAQNINESRLLSQDIDHAAQIFATSRISGADDRMRMSSQQPTPSYADDDDCATSGSSDRATCGNSDSDRQLLIQLSQALEYDRLQQHHTQRQLQEVDVPPAVRSGTADIAQQSETTTSDKGDDNHVSDVRASGLSTHTRSPEDSLTLGYDAQSAQIREYNRLQQAHMQKKQQLRPHDQTGNVNMHDNISSNNDTTSDLASHPIMDTTNAIESRPNETNGGGDVGEGSPYVDLDVLEAQLREVFHVSFHLKGGDVSSEDTESSSAKVTSTYEDRGSVALKAQLREYERLNRAHLQQQQLPIIEGDQKVEYKDETAVGDHSRTTDLRNSSGVGDRLFIDNHVATLNQIIDNHAATFNPTEQNSRHVICSTCNKALYVAPLVEFFLCPGCRNVTSSLDADHVT